MSLNLAERPRAARRFGRSALAVVAGVLTVAVLSLAADQALHSLGVYPPWGEPMHEPELNALALAYRCAFAVLGGYVTARLAPARPVAHAVILGVVGLLLSLGGVAATIGPVDLGPDWYPILLAITALPLPVLGGLLYVRQAARRSA